MGDLAASSPNALKTILTRSLLIRRVFIDVELGGVVAIKLPSEKAFLAQMLYVEGGTWTADQNFSQVCHKPVSTVTSFCPRWVTQSLPGE